MVTVGLRNARRRIVASGPASDRNHFSADIDTAQGFSGVSSGYARHSDTRLQTRLTPAGLQKRLLNLYTDARTLEEEQGVNILFLALGTLKWIDPANAQNVRYAPLVLIPVSLERGNAGEKFKLRWRQEDPASNLSLEAFLERIHGLKMPHFDAGDEFDPAAYFAAVGETVAESKRRASLWARRIRSSVSHSQTVTTPQPGGKEVEIGFFLPRFRFASANRFSCNFCLFLWRGWNNSRAGKVSSYRLEVADSEGAHSYPHVQLSRTVRNPDFKTDAEGWWSDSYPAFPLLANSPTGMFLALVTALHGYDRKNTASHAPGIIQSSMQAGGFVGRGLRLVSELDRLWPTAAYSWAYRILDTQAFGLPQRRRRLFMVASTAIDPRAVLLSDDAGARSGMKLALTKRPAGFYWTEGRSGVGLTDDALPPLKGGSGLGIASPPAALWPDGIVRVPGIAEAERLQGFPKGWTRAASGGRGVRWRLVGNAVSVPVAHWLGRRFQKPRPYTRVDEALLPRSKWPNSAWGADGRRWTAAVSDRPIDMGVPSLKEFASADWKSLSLRAASGFFLRTQQGSLRFSKGFLSRIEAYVERQSAAT